MSKFDDIYCSLAQRILSEGVQVSNRTGTDTIKVPSAHFQVDLQDEFPILTTKQVFNRWAILEMLWIYQAQSNDVRWLQQRGVTIWDKWAIDEDGAWRNDKTGQIIRQFDPSMAHTIGTAYGYIVRKYHLMDDLLDSIRNHPEDRRRVVSLWQNSELDTAVLPSCVWSSEWDVTDGKLNLWVHQRSCDVALGLPFNVTQYAVLLAMTARATGLEPGTIDWSIKDAHLYIDHIEPMKEQIRRWKENEPLPAPKLWLNPEKTDFYDFTVDDVKMEGYQHMGRLSFELHQ